VRERGVLLIGIEAANGAGLVEQVLREQRADERLADAALRLQDKMNRVLHVGLTSKVRECRVGRSRTSAACGRPALRTDPDRV
jgi:hypothetical protein